MLVHVSEMPWRRVRNAEATCQKCRGDGVGGGGEAGGGDGVSGRGGEMVVVTASVAEAMAEAATAWAEQMLWAREVAATVVAAMVEAVTAWAAAGCIDGVNAGGGDGGGGEGAGGGGNGGGTRWAETARSAAGGGGGGAVPHCDGPAV